MKIHHYQLVLNHRIDGLWEWTVFIWTGPSFVADAAIKSVNPFYASETLCLQEATKLLTQLGIMNKNTKRKKAENPGAFQPRKNKKPKVGASAAEITRRIAKERS